MRNQKPLIGAWPVLAGSFLATAVLIVASFATLVAPLIASAAGNGPVAAPAKEQLTEAQALDLQQKFEAAQLSQDAKTVSDLMADDVSFIHSSGQAQTKAEIVDSIVTGKMRISLNVLSRHVLVFDGGAVVQSTLDIGLLGAAKPGEAPRMIRIFQSNLWTHTGAGWQLTVSQGTLIPPPSAVR